MSHPTPTFAAFIGLDRSDAKLDLCLFVPGMAQPESSVLDNTPEQIAPWLESLRTRFNGHKAALCLEQTAGGLLHHLLGYDFIVLYAVNPMSLARHRETLVPSRAKSDASDAYYLMDLVRHYHAHLTAYAPGDEATRALAALVEARPAAVDLRTQLSNRLKAHLFKSLSGAGPINSARLLAAFGSDREKFAAADAVEQYTIEWHCAHYQAER